MKKTHDYIHYYRGYWSNGGRCRIRMYRDDGRAPVVICSQPPDNPNTFVTNMAEYLAAEVLEEHQLPTPLVWMEHYPEHSEGIGEYSLVMFSRRDPQEGYLSGVWRYRKGAPTWSLLCLDELEARLARGGERAIEEFEP